MDNLLYIAHGIKRFGTLEARTRGQAVCVACVLKVLGCGRNRVWTPELGSNKESE